ncbi:MAG: alkaline phytoceramidase [Epsilonproteobacteria bacterium]|nr:MAG: alkaline phytoceramidase [Campylobacterota bacterium]
MQIIKHNPMIFLAFMAMLILFGLSMLDPISQDITYHNFADTRSFYHISNFWNVLSNLAYLLVGLYAFYALLVSRKLVYEKQMKVAYMYFFMGIILVSFGSGYYHLAPNNETLIWDRLPMVIAFMSLFAIVISEFISLEEGKRLLYPLLVLGIFSVLYWAYTQMQGYGDLRLYVFVQFFPMLIIPMLLLYFKSTFTRLRGYWYLLVTYLAAKICEHFDTAIYEILGFMSGHTLKHILSAFGLYLLLKMMTERINT